MWNVKIHQAVQMLWAVKQSNSITNVPISHLYYIQLITALLWLDRFLSVTYCWKDHIFSFPMIYLSKNQTRNKNVRGVQFRPGNEFNRTTCPNWDGVRSQTSNEPEAYSITLEETTDLIHGDLSHIFRHICPDNNVQMLFSHLYTNIWQTQVLRKPVMSGFFVSKIVTV